MSEARVFCPVTTTKTETSTVTSRASGKTKLVTNPRTTVWETSSYTSRITRAMVRKAPAAENQHAARPATKKPRDSCCET